MNTNKATYPAYKDTGVHWMCTIPEHWKAAKIKEVLTERKEKNSPVKTDYILSLTAKKGVIPYSDKGRGGNKAKEDLSQYNLAYPDDLIVNCMNVVAGSVGLSKYYGAISPVYYALYKRNEFTNIKFINHVFQLKSFQRSLIGLGHGILMRETESGNLNTIRMRIPMSKLCRVLLPLPPKEEQHQIVRYLDSKLVKINKFIKNKKRLIELLKEQKQAVINQAVTKGLDPDAKMKPSGVEWLGDVPEGWVISKIGYIGRLQNGISEAGSFFGKGSPFISYGDVYNNDCLPQNIAGKANSNIKQQDVYSIKAGDVLFTRTSETIEEVGLSSICLKSINEAVFSGFLIRLRPYNNILDMNYSKYYFRSNVVRYSLVNTMNVVTRVSLSQSILRNAIVILPPLNEQESIYQYLEIIICKIDQTIDRITKEIALITEYRTSLISAVVTGKVDVRGIAVEEPPAEDLSEPNLDDIEDEGLREDDLLESEVG